jgi:hypothetical protein
MSSLERFSNHTVFSPALDSLSWSQFFYGNACFIVTILFSLLWGGICFHCCVTGESWYVTIFYMPHSWFWFPTLENSIWLTQKAANINMLSKTSVLNCFQSTFYGTFSQGSGIYFRLTMTHSLLCHFWLYNSKKQKCHFHYIMPDVVFWSPSIALTPISH